MTSQDDFNQRQFGEHLGPELAGQMGLHPALGGRRVPDVIEGLVARHVMNRANIRQTSLQKPPNPHNFLVDAPHIADAYQGGSEEGYRPHHEELWTSQSHLHVPTLREYSRGNIPEHDPYDEDVPYEPETYWHGGKRWLMEGHHRTVATRLMHRYD